MSQQVALGAKLTCTMGSAPAQLVVTPSRTVQVDHKLAATIMDFLPSSNIPTFAMCKAPTNPQVAAATTAASGVLTPQPCVPVTTSPWATGAPNVMMDNQIVLNNPSKLLCQWLGVITVSDPGQATTTVP